MIHKKDAENSGVNGDSKTIRSVERSGLSGAKTLRRPMRDTHNPSQMRMRNGQRPIGRGAMNRPPRRKRSIKKWIVLIILVLAAMAFLITTVFAKANINVTLASADVSIDGVFTAVREPLTTADISYTQSRKHDKTLNHEITNITREQENSRATGTITVYNTNPSGTRLDLVNRTRFQTEDGRIYRMIGKQTIPGGRTIAGEFQPGSKEIRVEADEIGTSYNLQEKGEQFSIPGLAKFKPFADSYAVSNTPIVGGFSGEKLIPNPQEEREARERLREQLKKDLHTLLFDTLETNTLAERIVFEDGIFVKYESLEDLQNDATGSVTIRERAYLRAILFREKELAALLSQYAPDSSPNTKRPERIQPSELVMEIEAKDDFDIFAEEESNEIRFRLKGDTTIFWGIDTYLFLSDVLGKKRGLVESDILREYPQIVSINDISVFPYWRTVLPKNRNKINLEVLYND